MIYIGYEKLKLLKIEMKNFDYWIINFKLLVIFQRIKYSSWNQI